MFEHFLKYQNGDVQGYPSYEKAFHEISVDKKKTTHWIWYIVPYDLPSKQHTDLFVLKENNISLYLQKDQLRNNYIEIINSISDVLAEKMLEEYEQIMSRIDLNKVYRSAILFKKNCSSFDQDIINACNRIINLLKEYIEQCRKKNLERKALMQLMKNFKPI